jgi:Protein of unknown function (DUF2855)
MGAGRGILGGVPELQVRRDDLSSSRLAEGEPLREDLDEGEALLLVERLALSANNITYAIEGDRLGYWRLSPAPGGWGRIPAWGYARVIGSRSPVLRTGERFFGLFPIGRYAAVRPAPHQLGFVDAAPHRSELPPVYNQYLAADGEGDDVALIMRPLFTASVLLDLKLDATGFDSVVLTSASSKAAYGLAHLLRRRPVETVGLTSAARRAWVVGLGFYDTVLTYDNLSELTASGPAVLVDFAGDPIVVREVHERLADALMRSILVGLTHGTTNAGDAPHTGPAPEFFFAPDEIVRHGREFARRYFAAWREFAPIAGRTLRIERITDGHELERVYRELLAGPVDPAAAYVASL